MMSVPQMQEFIDTMQRELVLRGVFFDHEAAA